MKKVCAALCFLFSASSAFAQFTVVTGTVTDVNGLPYSGASLTITLSLPTGAIGAYLNGAQISGTVGPLKLDNTGAFIANLADNTQVKCASTTGALIACVPQTQWSFAVTLSPGVAPPLGNGSQTCNSGPLTISGSAQSVTSTFNSCPKLSSTGGAPGNNVQFANATKFGVVADGIAVNDASWTNGANPVVVTSASANFLASRDNGKVCWGNDAASGLNTAPTGILTVVNSTTANCSGTATGTSTTASFRWGTDDTAGWLAVNAVAAASETPTCIVGPSGLSVITKAPLIDPRPAGLWAWCFAGPNGGLTTFLPTPTFDPTTCTGATLSACIWEPHQSAISQNVVPQYAKLNNIGVDGSNFRCTLGFANKAAFGLTKTEGTNIWAWNWCGTAAGVSNFTGINLLSPNSVFNLNANNIGGVGIQFSAIGFPTETLLGSSYSGAMLDGSDLIVGSGNIVVSKGNSWQACANACLVVGTNAVLVMDGDIGIQTSGTQFVDVSGTLIVEGGTQIVPTSTTRAILTRAGGKAFLRDSGVSIGAGGVALNINTVPGGSIINNGNVQITGTDQTLLAASNIVLSAGWGATATVTNLSGTPDSNPTRFSFQANSSGAGQAANPTITITYPASTLTTPAWTCKQTGGSGALTVISGESGASATAMTLTFNGTPVAGLNYILTCTGSLQ